MWVGCVLALSCVSTFALAQAPLMTPALKQRLQQPFSADIDNLASLQRGAQMYFNYCAGCHSLQYESYPNIADYLGINREQTTIIRRSFLFDPAGDINRMIESALGPGDSVKWFGVAPPDLTQIVLQKSPGWLLQFLKGFYSDSTRPHGTNNILAADTAMPNVLSTLRGEVQPVYQGEQIDHFVTVKAGQLSPLEFDRRMQDLVNFLTKVAEPWHNTRIWLGIAICLLLFLLACVFHYLFKKPLPSQPS